jgi:hypothetical protein
MLHAPTETLSHRLGVARLEAPGVDPHAVGGPWPTPATDQDPASALVVGIEQAIANDAPHSLGEVVRLVPERTGGPTRVVGVLVHHPRASVRTSACTSISDPRLSGDIGSGPPASFRERPTFSTPATERDLGQPQRAAAERRVPNALAIPLNSRTSRSRLRRKMWHEVRPVGDIPSRVHRAGADLRGGPMRGHCDRG